MEINELLKLKDIMYEQLDIEALPDLSNVTIDTNIPISERVQNYCYAIKNPYFLKVGKTIVRVEFLQDRGSIENKIKDYLKSTKLR